MNKSIAKLAPCEQETADAYIESVKRRCLQNRMTVTLWLLFDTVAERDSLVRDRMLRDFKKYASASALPRSVAEGAKWLAKNAGGYRGN